MPTLLAHFPSLRSPRSSSQVIPAEKRIAYPSLETDFAVLDRTAGSAFRESDIAALMYQNRYRRQQVLILLGSTVATGLGGLQAMLPDQRWPGVLLAVLGIALAASSRASSELGLLTEYLTERIKAERLRALHFRFLSRTGPYAAADRETTMRRAAVAIQSGRELR